MKWVNNLRYLRRLKSVSQIKFGADIKVKRGLIEAWEVGRAVPQTEHFVKISNYFHVSIDYFIKYDLSEISKRDIIDNYILVQKRLKP